MKGRFIHILQNLIFTAGIISVNGIEIPKIITGAYDTVSTGVVNAAAAGASYVPDPQDALTYVPRVVADARQAINDALVSQDPQDVRFLLYSDKKNPEDFIQIDTGKDGLSPLKSSLYNSANPIKILIHGFRQTGNSTYPQIIKDAYLKHTDNNVIVVDWGELSRPSAGILSSAFYTYVVDNVPRVGERVADLIVDLLSHGFISDLRQIHIVGFSLGGHVSGIAGNSVKRRMKGKMVGRITGLDAAGPSFLLAHKERRLGKEDAEFVDAIHTSKLGYMTQIGHADFFPNGGLSQPLCFDPDFNPLETISNLGSILTGSCSHARAFEFFNRSLTEDIQGCKCSGWVEYAISCGKKCPTSVRFGEHCPPDASGSYYLDIKPYS